MYSYLASISNVTFNTTSLERSIAYNPSIYSFSDWEDCRTFGVMFGFASGLFKLIPQVCQFGRDRFLEGTDVDEVSASSLQTYEDFQTQICDWQIPIDANGCQEAAVGSSLVAHIYREALLIYLHAAFFASGVSNSIFRHKIEALVTKLLPLMDKITQLPSISSLCSVLLWPSIIMGSCLQWHEERQAFRQIFGRWQHGMAISDRAVQLLEWVWEEDNNSVFGPYGFEIVMNRHKINFCMG